MSGNESSRSPGGVEGYLADRRAFWSGRDFKAITESDPLRVEIHRRETALLVGRVLRWSPAAVLDVGCAHGLIVSALARAGVPRVLGVDLSPLAVEQARTATAGLAGVEILEAGAEALPLENDSVDVVVTRSVLAHLPPDLAARARAEMVRVARAALVHLENETDRGSRAYSFLHDNAAEYRGLGLEARAEPGPEREHSTLTTVTLGSPARAPDSPQTQS